MQSSAMKRWPRAVIAILLLVVTGQAVKQSGLATAPGTALSYMPSGRLVPVLTNDTPFEVQIEDFHFAGTTGNLIDDSVYYTGNYETHVLHLLRDLIREGWTGGNAVALDIGANVGVHTLYLSQYARHVHAVEPWPPALERLDSLIARNGVDNVTVHRVGYSNEVGSLPYYAPPADNLGTGSFDPAFSVQNTESEALPLVDGDSHLAEAGVPQVDLVKIDIEGFERYALLGLTRTLHTGRPLVLLELNPVEGGFRSEDELRTTFPPDYRFYDVGTTGTYGAWAIILVRWAWIYGPVVTGDYILAPYDMKFSRQARVLAVPGERIASFQHILP